MLCDNPVLFPLGTLAISGDAPFLETRSAVGLRRSTAAMFAIPLVHLMGIALVVPLAAHLLIASSRGPWSQRVGVAAIALAALVMARPYLTYLASQHLSSPGGDRPATVGSIH